MRNARELTATVAGTALAFAGTAIVLAIMALHALYVGRWAGSPRRTVLAAAAITLAATVVGISAITVLHAVLRRRRLAALLRPGEELVGVYRADLLAGADDLCGAAVQRVGITLTNQRLLAHPPNMLDAPWLDLEHDEIADATDLGPAMRGRLRRCLGDGLELTDGRRFVLRMNAHTALDFRALRARYLEPGARQVRALVVHAEGPAPAQAAVRLDALTPDERPAACWLELGEHYLQVDSEHTSPLTDLHCCFPWEQTRGGALEQAGVPGYPGAWRRVRLVLAAESALELCGTQAAMARLRSHALAAGAKMLED